MDLAMSKYQNLELEMEFLGTILLSEPQLQFVLSLQILESQDFFHTQNQKLFDLIDARFKQNLLINQAIQKKWFEDNIDLGGMTYLKNLWDSASSITDIKLLALAVKDLSSKRKFERLLGNYLTNELSKEKTMVEIADDINTQIQEVVYNIPSTNKPISLEDVFSTIIKNENEENISLGYSNIDNLINKVDLGSFVILAGRPSMGKSSFALNMAINLSKSIPVLFLSLEVSNIQIGRRAMANLGDISLKDIRSEKPIAYESRLIAKNKAKELKLSLRDTGGITLPTIRNEVKKFKASGGKLIIIDYIQLIKHVGKRNSSTTDDITAITNELKSLAMEYKIVILGLSQLNRGVEHRDNKRPLLSDLRSSGSIEQDADVVMFIHRPEYYINQNKPKDENSQAYYDWERQLEQFKNKAFILIAKARDGKTGDCEFFANFDKQQFYEVIKNETH